MPTGSISKYDLTSYYVLTSEWSAERATRSAGASYVVISPDLRPRGPCRKRHAEGGVQSACRVAEN